MTKHTHKEEALRLRIEQRMSLNEIADTLGISKSSASLWLRDHPLTVEELAKRKAEKDASQIGKKAPAKEALLLPSLHHQQVETAFDMRSIAPKKLGEISESIVATALLRLGFDLLRPIGDSLRYDLMLDFEDKTYRIQVKTARVTGDAVEFCTVSSQVHRGKGVQSYKGQIEWFAVCVPETGEVFMLPISDISETAKALRLRRVETVMSPNCRLARDYALNKAWKPNIHWPVAQW
jgi:hypothetical protein